MEVDNPVYNEAVFDKSISGLPRTVHGYFYQVKLCMWYLVHLLNEKFDFELTSEWNDGKRFNDLVAHFNCNGEERIIFLQAKHKREGTKKVTWFSPSEFIKYFDSYLQIKSNEKFEKTCKSYALFTNIEFTNTMGDKFKKVIPDPIDLIKPPSYRCIFKDQSKFKMELVENYKKCTEKRLSDIGKLVKALVKNLNKPIQTENQEIFFKFKKFLCKYVLEQNKDREDRMVFQKQFTEHSIFLFKLPESVKKFHECFYEALQSENKQKSLRSSFIISDNFFVTTNEDLDDDVGESLDPEEFPCDTLNFEHTEDFFKEFSIIVTENEEQLDNTIIKEMAEYYEIDEDDRILKNAFKILFYKIFDWMKQKKVKPITNKRARDILFDIRRDLMPLAQ